VFTSVRLFVKSNLGKNSSNFLQFTCQFGGYDSHFYGVTDSLQIKYKIETSKPIFSSPCQHMGNIYFGDIGGNLYCTNSGQIMWKTYLNGPIFSSPTVDEKSGTVVIGSCDNKIYAFSSSGKEVNKLIKIF
jgi:outer membrane protein assembly factor BamB